MCDAKTCAAISPAKDPLIARTIPERSIPVPGHVSGDLQQVIRSSPARTARAIPRSDAEWRAEVANLDRAEDKPAVIAELLKEFPARIEQETTAGVHTYTITPSQVPFRNRARAFVYVHGGGYVMSAGELGIDEAVLLAGHSEMRIIAVDYRMPPDSPFPAAVDDVVAVWRDVVSALNPTNVGIGGTSAGGGLAIAAVMKLRAMGLPLPGAVYAGTPWVDLTNSGDSMSTNEYLDNGLSGYADWMIGAARLYAGAHDVRDPLISPVFGDFSRFPPTILLSGTRDMLLSDTVRTHRKLRAAGIPAELHVFEAMSHAEYCTVWKTPESREAYCEVTTFLDRHLGH
jgi:monoterpene epsilon-lactone hydrolase